MDVHAPTRVPASLHALAVNLMAPVRDLGSEAQVARLSDKDAAAIALAVANMARVLARITDQEPAS
ncbi:hypothetical protein [Roseomonas sp. CECT 9278]|uniref:hypothetical protein n=1 Tax=Roseomonas sp. CECT 9278 TaxID=2845823 RepID=UPI001E33A41A|nr:hypothetical protein [Roseomonas sp. CECT 9278]CAH0169502.1 hypothetical protein ROS9278_01160 [Roseomonas sp. CECT 9278]